MKNNYINDVLKLYSNFVFFLDMTIKNVELVLDGDAKIAENISYDDFCDLFKNHFNLNNESRDKMKRFIDQLNIGDNNIFTFEVKYDNVDGEKIPMVVKGKRVEETKAIISLSTDLSARNKDYDELTKTMTTETLQPYIKNAIQQSIPFILVLLDIDHFADFNHKYGNILGDVLLVETAASIKKIIKANGYVARESSDRFLIMLFVDDDYDIIHAACSNLRYSVMDLTNHNVKQANITTTLGIASFPKDGDNYDILYKKAYLGLQRGKLKGRNCFIIYKEEKCGSADNFVLPETNFEYSSNLVTNFNIVAGVYEIINRKGSREANINDALSLIGTYFLLDRINFFVLDPEKGEIIKIYSWHAPLVSARKLKPNQSHIEPWHKSYNNLGMVKIVQVDSNKDLPIYNILKEDDVSSLLAIDLFYTDIEVGLLRFEMANSNRFWNQSDISTLNLISKLFSTFIYKQYEAEKFERDLSYDRLTNVYNYSKWFDVVYDYLYTNKTDEYSMIHFNFANFVHLADVLGVEAANNALEYTADALRKYSTDEIFARLSEDRFIVFSPSTDENYLEEYMKNISNYVLENYKYGYHYKLHAGICIHNSSDTLNQTIDKANITRKNALDNDKLLLFFTDDFYERQKIINELERHQNDAMKNGEFKLYLQPKIDTITNKIAGAEALTRWKYKNEKMVYPDMFIPLFEKNGFIKELDLHVFENVCKFQKDVIDSGYEPVTISVNLSMYQNNFDEYLFKINEIKDKYNIPAKYLEIEITESTFVKNIAAVNELMKNLHENGYKISMDDFGTGYSNLSSLASFDFDTIKLDKNFCSDKEKEKERIILQFVVKLAKSLDINVLCEGVETKELVDFLKDIGCTLIQGYYFDKPMPAEDLKEKYLKN